jgi:hypothetical protein
VLWSLVADDFAGVALRGDLGAEWLAAVDAPAPTDPADLARASERIWTLTRLFNAREGFDSTDDRLPVVFTRPLAGGPADGWSLDRERFRALRHGYYAARGWSSDGIPARPLLQQLYLAAVIDDATQSPTRRPSRRPMPTTPTPSSGPRPAPTTDHGLWTPPVWTPIIEWFEKIYSEAGPRKRERLNLDGDSSSLGVGFCRVDKVLSVEIC